MSRHPAVGRFDVPVRVLSVMRKGVVVLVGVEANNLDELACQWAPHLSASVQLGGMWAIISFVLNVDQKPNIFRVEKVTGCRA
jgi:hypothetical protein